MLKVFISAGCRGCQRAQELALWIAESRPQLEVRTIDLSVEPDAGDGIVFAIPTYVYQDEILFLGNPSWQELQHWLDSLDQED